MNKKHHIIFRSLLALLLTLFLIGCSDNNDETDKEANNETNHSSSNEDASLDTNDNNDDDETSSDNSDTDSKTDSGDNASSNDSNIEDNNENNSNSEDNTSSSETESKNNDSSHEEDAVSEENNSNESSGDILSNYSSEEIEYARVWLQLGELQVDDDLEELNVRHISAGEPVNRLDEESAEYPEDVIELRGGKLIDGAVTYSSNGDGTINVYNVPARWEMGNNVDKELLQKEYEKAVENTELVEVGEEEDIKETIDEVMVIH
ncbi:hypothetical protein [Oceanobacillus timonensis]|uniref:hypothetical protein n=1 Tax=Oceanobacillus timonensis TaxID=1926285 RepID=UPI0009B9786D|nr:hypothetical protein [Oceanobacillus timonensis]